MAKSSELQLHSAVSATARGHSWPVASQVIRALFAIAATFHFAVAHAAEESASRIAFEAWPEEAVVAFERVQVGEEGVIQGDVTVLFPDRTVASTHGVESGKTATLQGAVRTEVIATQLPSFPWFTPGIRRVQVASGSSSNLASGSYGRVTVGSSEGPSAVLTLAGGIYNIVSLQLGRSSQIECTDACELRVLTTVRLDNSASLGPAQDAGVHEEAVRVFVAGTDVDNAAAVQLGEAAQIHAHLYAPNGTVVFGPAANATGHIIGRTVRLERAARISVSLAGFSAGSSPAEQSALAVTVSDGGVQTFRLEPYRKVRVKGLFVQYGASFGLGPADTVMEQEVRGSQESGLHHRYRQFHHGLPVLGANFIVQETRGLVISGIGRLVSGLDIDPNPELSERAALEFALKAIGVPANGPETPPSFPGMRAIASKGGSMAPGSFHLVYRFEVRAPRARGREMIDIDGRTGEVVNRFPLFANYTTSGGGDTLHYGWKPFLVDSFPTVEGKTRYRLSVPDFLTAASNVADHKGIWTARALGLNTVVTPVPGQGFILGDYVVEEIVNDTNDFRYWPAPSFGVASTNLPSLIYGVSLNWGVQQAVEYWKKVNWIGLDGKGKWDIFALIDCKEFYGESNAAFIDPQTLCFGTGPSNISIFGLHTIGHEFAHGVFWYATGASTSSGFYSGETGEVDEGIADLFGYLLDQNATNWCGQPQDALTLYYKGSCGGPTALCPSEQCDPTGVCSTTYPLECKGRNLANPKETGNPDTYAGQYWVTGAASSCEVNDHCHHNSSIVGHWFYILVNGKQGINDWKDVYNVVGIGRQKAEEIVQRTLLQKLGSPPTFFALRAASIQAAEDSGSSEVVAAVTNAWYAVGVGDPYDPRTYSPSKVSGVEPWPAVLKWEELDGETDWEVEISTDSSFDSDVQVLAPTASQATAFGKVMLTTKANLKPTTKYYWRVHARSAEPPKRSSALDLSAEKKKPPLVRPGRGRKTPGAANLAEPVGQLPAIADVFLGGWNPWGATQKFETGAKVPDPIAPDAPPGLGRGLPGTEVVAPGSYYPWNAVFSWNPVPGATSYRITVSESPNRSCGPSSGKKQLPSSKFPSGLQTTVQSVTAPNTAGPVKQEIPLKSDHTYYWWLMVYGPDSIPGGCAYSGDPIRFQTDTPKATLNSPGNGDHVSPFQATLTWNEVEGATGYLVQWRSEKAKWTAGETVPSASMVSASIVIEPGAVGTYYWRVRPIGPLSGDMGAVSSTWSFVTDIDLTKPNPYLPEDEGLVTYGNSTESLKFRWFPVPAATGYQLTIYHRTDHTAGQEWTQIDSGFQEVPKAGQGSEPIVSVDVENVRADAYCWTVKASGANMAGASSDLWCYRIGAAKPFITSPQMGANVEYDPTIVEWTCAYCPSGVNLRYWPELAGFGAAQVVPGLTGSSTPLALAPDTTYLMDVRAINPDGTLGAMSDQISFRTKAEPAPATCSKLGQGAILIQSPGGTPYGESLPQDWDRQLYWIEFSHDIKDYRVTAFAVGKDIIATSSSILADAASLPTIGQITIGDFTGDAKAFSLPGYLPWSMTELPLPPGAIGYFFVVRVEGRSKQGGDCPWVFVGGTFVTVAW
jgi:Zn-dependent metalloprotease